MKLQNNMQFIKVTRAIPTSTYAFHEFLTLSNINWLTLRWKRTVCMSATNYGWATDFKLCTETSLCPQNIANQYI